MKHPLDPILYALALAEVLFTRLLLPAARAIITSHAQPTSHLSPQISPLPVPPLPADITLRRMTNAQLRALVGTKRHLSRRQLMALIERGYTQATA
jgi:hypothetical protein